VIREGGGRNVSSKVKRCRSRRVGNVVKVEGGGSCVPF
jgi:hypothetical protein